MKHIYSTPKCDLLLLDEQDVIVTSLTATLKGDGDFINFEDYLPGANG